MNQLSLKKGTIMFVFILVLVFAVLIVTGTVGSPNEAPQARIMSDSNGNPIAYEILLNQWNGVMYDRLSYSDVLFEKAESGEVPVSDTDRVITFDFGRNQPDKVSLIVDYNTNPMESYRRPTFAVPLDGMAFLHPLLPSGYPANAGRRFYVLTCSWGENEAEYAFVVDVRNEPAPDNPLSLSATQVDWLEISLLMGTTTYVDDISYIEKVLTILTETELRPATAEEIVRIKEAVPAPAEITIGENTYPRNVAIEFVRRSNGDMAENLATVQLLGDAVSINGNYFISDTVTNDFLAILNEIHSQGKGKTSVEILTPRETLTLDLVRALATGEITPADIIKKYDGSDVTSGIYSFYSEFEGYSLLIGYTDPNNPQYVRLTNLKTGESIDPTTPEALNEFLTR